MIMVSSCAASGSDNLLIGGIWQDQNSQALNLKYAELLGAKFVPTYYSDDGTLDKAWGFVADPASVQTATPWYKYDLKTGERVGHFDYLPNDRNGLNNALISGNDDDYDTIYAHSGGARTAVTAMLYQGVTADKLVLIDPARGVQLEADYEYEIQKLLDKDVDIDYYYYKADNLLKEPPLSFIWRGGTDLQQGGSSGILKPIPVESEDLGGLTGKDAHIQIFYYVLNNEAKCSSSCPDQINIEQGPKDAEVEGQSSSMSQCKTTEAESLYNEGNAAYDQGNYKDAIQHYDEAINICPRYAKALFGKGDVFFVQGNLMEAIQWYDETIKVDTQYVEAWNNKGTALYLRGDYDGAIKCYNEAIKIDPQYEWAWSAKGQTLYKKGSYNDAIQCIDKAIALNPEIPTFWEYKRDTLRALGQTEAAQAAAEKADELKNTKTPTKVGASGGLSYD